MNIDGLDTIKQLHSTLTGLAGERRTVIYSDAMQMIGWDYKNTYQRNVFAYLLKAVSYLELGVGHPPLTAVVVAKDTGRPNEAFFKFARLEQRLRKDETDEAYWQREVERVFVQWEKAAA